MSQVVRFHHHDGMSGYTPLSMASRLTLTEDVCVFKTDENEPRTIEMAVRHRQVFERANESRLIKQVLCSADWFAIYYSTRFVHTLRVSHVLVFPTGLACVSGTDFNAESSSMPGGRIGTAENDFGRRRILRLLGRCRTRGACVLGAHVPQTRRGTP